MHDLHLQLATDEDEPIVSAPLEEDLALELMRRAEITDVKLIPWGSNYSFAVALEDEDSGTHLAIYKPRRGESPLWDFESGTLYRREHASYRLSRRLGWTLVPPTIIREGPHGTGSVQLYVQPKSAEAERIDDVYQFWSAKHVGIERMVMFDHIANNADRKLSHCLRGADDRIWGIDHGLTFNVEPKLRTVLWQYAGEVISPELLQDLQRVLEDESGLRSELASDLHVDEVEETVLRMQELLRAERYPQLDPYENVPRGW